MGDYGPGVRPSTAFPVAGRTLMADHMVYQVRVQFSLDPEEPTKCVGEEIRWRRPGEDSWTLHRDNAHGANPLEWCEGVVNLWLDDLAKGLPPALPFP